MTAAREARDRGASVTLCYWHPALEEPGAVAEHYHEILDAVTRDGLDAHLAIKVPGLWERSDLIGSVVERARGLAVQVDIDSHEPEKAIDVQRAVEHVGPEGVAVAIPGRWSQSVELANWAADRRLAVRVVKGSWKDPLAPRIDPYQGYLDVVRSLAGRAREVGVATHNLDLARESFRLLSESGTPAVQELVYGLPMEKVSKVGSEFGVPVRVYIPFGATWVPYAIKRALKEPRIIYFLAKDLASGGRDPLPPPVVLAPKSVAGSAQRR